MERKNAKNCTILLVALPPPVDPCTPSPCGLYAECRVIGDQAACSCLKNYIGLPPNCRPECVVNTDCASNQACISEKCRDPCIGSCGENANCRVQNHIPVCLCQPGFTGDPFSLCSPIIGDYWIFWFLSCRTTEATRRSMQSIALWTKRRVQPGNLHVSFKLFRRSILVLSSRMHYELGLFSSEGVCQPLLRGPMRGHVWNQCKMWRS